MQIVLFPLIFDWWSSAGWQGPG